MHLDYSTLAAILGLVMTPYTILLGRLQMMLSRLRDKMESVYTKGETKEMVELMTSPIKDTTDSLIASHDKLIDAIHKLEIVLATTHSATSS